MSQGEFEPTTTLMFLSPYKRPVTAERLHNWNVVALFVEYEGQRPDNVQFVVDDQDSVATQSVISPRSVDTIRSVDLS